MKRITVSLPDEIADRIRNATGGERTVSSYVVAALEDYAEREDLASLLASWNEETPIPYDVRRQVQLEMDEIGLADSPAHNAGRGE